MGDVFRRLVARTIAQQISPTVERGTAPFQYALTTRAGAECIAHVIQTLTDVDQEATVLSVDGVGAFDLISRVAMLEGLRSIDGGDSVLPFVSPFYGTASTYVQGEGGEQGDPLMPARRSAQSIGGHKRAVAPP